MTAEPPLFYCRRLPDEWGDNGRFSPTICYNIPDSLYQFSWFVIRKETIPTVFDHHQLQYLSADFADYADFILSLSKGFLCVLRASAVLFTKEYR